VIFDPSKPLETDPALYDEGFDYAWRRSLEDRDAYYAWLQPVVEGVGFHDSLESLQVEMGHGVVLYVYYGAVRQEILYRLLFTQGFPSRLILKPAPYTLFWSYGSEGGQSMEIKYHYRDRYLSIHEWTDKDSFLAVLRQQHYDNNVSTIWSR